MGLKNQSGKKTQQIIGWREWVTLPELGIPRLKAKIDTGARTSAIHAFKLEPYRKAGKRKIKFLIHPVQHDNKTIIECDSVVSDIRWVTDSGGHREKRYVIVTTLLLANFSHDIEVTLTNRDTMRFRMLIGRSGLKPYFIVNPARSFLAAGSC